MNSIEDSILKFLSNKKNSKYSFKEIITTFNATEEESELLKIAIDNLISKGKIYVTNDLSYMLFPIDSELRQGKLNINNKKECYITDNNSAIFIANNYLNGAIVGDIVLVKKENNNCGTVKKIVLRNEKTGIFECVLINDKKVLKPYNFPFYFDIKLSDKDLKNIVPGERVLIKLDKEKTNNSFNGTIISSIGHKDDPSIDIKMIAIKNGIPQEFSEEVLKEVENIENIVEEDEMRGRADFTDKIIFTIDDVNTKDMDDAISLEKNDKGNYVLGVHIADVSYYVNPIKTKAIFNEAFNRGNSYYYDNSVTPMLHHKLSNGICSLNPNEYRLTKSVLIEFDEKGNVVDYTIVPKSVIKSKKKMSYEDVNKVLSDIDIKSLEEYKSNLKQMEKLYETLAFKRKKRGQIDFGDFEIEIKYNKNQKPIGITLRKRGIAERMIEQFMLSANEVIGTDIFNKALTSIYRVHDTPNEEKLREILEYLKLCGYKIKIPNNLSNPHVISGILDKLKDLKEYSILSPMIVQGMKKAIYSSFNIGHFGIGIKANKGEAYSHFTSPIRRFSDLLLHLLIDKYYSNEDIDIKDLDKFIDKACKQCSKTEVIADKNEREVTNYRTAEFIERNIGQNFHGFITYISSSSITVITDDYITGKVLVSDLGEKFKFNPKNITLSNGSFEYHVGDEINLIAKSANKETGKIIFKQNKKNLVRTRN